MAYPAEDDPTLLAFDGPGIQPYSGRGLTQTLEPADGSGIVRTTINGLTLDRSAEQFRKYKSTISCTDLEPAAFDGIWPGQTLTVSCAIFLSYKSGGSPSRSVVSGSEVTVGDYVKYRPSLLMMVLPGSPRQTFDEWGCANGWAIDLIETQAPSGL